MTSEAGRPLSRGVLVALLVVTALAGALAVRVAPEGQPVAAFWPAAAAAVLVLSLTPRQRWAPVAVLVLAAVLVGDLVGGRPATLAAGHAVVETLGALAATLLLTQRGRRGPALDDVPDFLRLLGAALISGGLPMVVAAVAGPTRDLHLMVASLAAVLATHTAAVLVLVPLALGTPHRWTGGRVELAVQMLLLAAACVLAFLPGSQTSVLTFAPVIFLTWAALRFDMQVVAGELVVFACFVTTLDAHRSGPFASLAAHQHVSQIGAAALSQTFLACIALIVLPLGIATQLNSLLLERITADGRLFRRNFTESLVGMAFLEPDPGGADLRVVDLNDTAVAILGRHDGELVGARLRDLVSTGREYDEVLPRLLSGDLEGWRVECPLTGARAGRVVLQVSPLSERGDAPLFALQLLDVTAESRARRELEVAEQLTATTLDTTACIIMVIDLEGVVVRVNAATSTITGYDEQHLLGRPVWETGVAPAAAADIEALMTWPNRSGAPIVQESDVLTRTGDRLHVVWNTNLVRDEDGQPTYAVMTGIDVTAERTTRSLVDHLMEASFTTALVGIDTRGRISVVNSGLAHLLGYRRDELVGEPFHRLMKPSELLDRTGADTMGAAFATLVRGLGVDGETRARDWTWLTRSGDERVVSMSLSVSQTAASAHGGGYLCVARDVAETRKSQEMLIAALDKERTAVERLRALDQAKNQFVSTVSHELRTPVTSIVGYAEMMIDGTIVEPLPDQIPLLETIERNGQRLISMINDLLMLGGLDSGTVQLRREPFDLAAIVDPVEASVRPLLLDRDLVLDVDRPAYAVAVMGDRVQLERVLTNLVTNAVKFTEDGGRIGVHVGVSGGEALLEVSDTGIGIPDDEQDALFQRFFRSSTAQTRQIQGTGLGLSIVAEIVASHGGTIAVRSVHLRGSTFTVRLPLDLAQGPVAAVVSGSDSPALVPAPRRG